MFKQDGNHHSTMVDVVQRQTLTFRCLELMNDVFSFQLLSQLLTIVVTLCMGMVIINDKGIFTITTYIQLMMMSSSTLQAFVYCFFGDFISDKLHQTIFSIYSSDWYMNSKEAKNVIILMQRANKINTFTFGGLLNMDLNTFALIMKNSFSFYALLSAKKPIE
ncbi:odorant receptor 23a-like [Atheta coriaria]|uniref:odorant receptor 23a-like n=1 Tax=Dalotia coriaria TaxID=877792 RepID=UPI0031F3AFFB